jgi:large subunit ribosomal protein L4
MKVAALRGALSDRAREERIHVVSELVTGDVPSTKSATASLHALGLEGRVLVVVSRDETTSWLSLRNVDNAHVVAPDQLNTYDVIVSDQVLFTKAALEAFLEGTPKGKSIKSVARQSEVEA